MKFIIVAIIETSKKVDNNKIEKTFFVLTFPFDLLIFDLFTFYLLNFNHNMLVFLIFDLLIVDIHIFWTVLLVCSDLKTYTNCPQLVYVPYFELIEL